MDIEVDMTIKDGRECERLLQDMKLPKPIKSLKFKVRDCKKYRRKQPNKFMICLLTLMIRRIGHALSH